MTDTADELKPCVRGCTYRPSIEGEEPKPRPARHGGYCNRCFHNTNNALAMTGALVEHILSLVGSKGGQDDEAQKTKGSPPLPFNVEAFNDANEVYSRLVYWARLLADLLHIPAPAPAASAWADIFGSIRGLPADVEAGTARLQVQAMAAWLQTKLEAICELAGDDIDFFHDDWKDVFRLAAKWPTKARPRYSDMPCPDSGCSGRIAVYPPDDFGDDERIVCEGCGRWFPPEQYEHLILVFKQIRAESKSASGVRSHLQRKYAV